MALSVAVIALAACSAQSTPMELGATGVEVDSAESTSTPTRDLADPNRTYTQTNPNDIGTVGDIQFINSYATW